MSDESEILGWFGDAWLESGLVNGPVIDRESASTLALGGRAEPDQLPASQGAPETSRQPVGSASIAAISPRPNPADPVDAALQRSPPMTVMRRSPDTKRRNAPDTTPTI